MEVGPVRTGMARGLGGLGEVVLRPAVACDTAGGGWACVVEGCEASYSQDAQTIA